MPTYRSASVRRSSIYPITIQTPHGAVLLAYRVEEGKPGPLFLVEFDQALRSASGSAFLDDFAPNVEDVLAQLWAECLPAPDRAFLERLDLLGVELVERDSK